MEKYRKTPVYWYTVYCMVWKPTVTGSFYLDTVKLYVLRCAIWYHLYNLKNLKNTHRGVLHLVKLQAKSLQHY